MCNKKFNLTLVLVLILVQNTKEFRFLRQIKAMGHPYYNILMALGACKDKVLFIDQKIWGQIKLNRVLDIYFKSDNDVYKVSRVEIQLIINDTGSFAYSEAGVGYSEFAATLYLPTNLSFVLYALTIYTCNRDRDSAEFTSFTIGRTTNHTYMPFLRSDNAKSTTMPKWVPIE